MRSETTGMIPFAGRLGGNQTFILDRSDPANAEVLQRVPDAAPNLNLREIFELRGFTEGGLWKAAIVECFGTFIMVQDPIFRRTNEGSPTWGRLTTYPGTQAKERLTMGVVLQEP